MKIIQQNKRLIGIFIALPVFIFICILLCSCGGVKPERICHTVEFGVIEDYGGHITGQNKQIVAEGSSTSKVCAVPNQDYYFVGWIDGSGNLSKEYTSRELVIDNVTCDLKLWAKFELFPPYIAPRKYYTYVYNYADAGCDENEVSIYKRDGIENIRLAVPTREHAKFCGWYSDYLLTDRMTDEKGKIIVSDIEFMNCESDKLYAKWETDNTHTYKILIVYVTEVNGNFLKNNGSYVQVNYKMSDNEQVMCHKITEQVQFELNSLALCNFIVDEYFTTEPLTEENFIACKSYNDLLDYRLFAYNIPEVRKVSFDPVRPQKVDMFNEYLSVLVSFSLNDYMCELHVGGVIGRAKYGMVNFDGETHQINDLSLTAKSFYTRDDFRNWQGLISSYLSSLAVTVGSRIPSLYDYTMLPNDLYDRNNPHKEIALYFLNKAIVDGKKVGIPYEFWKGNVVKIYYEANINGESKGYINCAGGIYGEFNENDGMQYVIKGRNSVSARAVPNEGCKFVKWSDGVTTAIRWEKNVEEDMYVYAIFEPVDG